MLEWIYYSRVVAYLPFYIVFTEGISNQIIPSNFLTACHTAKKGTVTCDTQGIASHSHHRGVCRVKKRKKAKEKKPHLKYNCFQWFMVPDPFDMQQI